MIDHGADRPVYKQLADILRHAIAAGEIPPGQMLRPEPRLAAEHGVGRDAVRDALALLRGEGWIRTRPRVGSFVREHPEKTIMELQPGDTVAARMPTEPERRELGIDEGVPVIVITREGADDQVLPADRFQLRAPGD